MKFKETLGEMTRRIKEGGKHPPLRSFVELCKEIGEQPHTVIGRLKMEGAPTPVLRHNSGHRGNTAWYNRAEFLKWWKSLPTVKPVLQTRYCDECKHFNDEDVPGARVCEKNHKPKFYQQKHDNPLDTDYGYKRRCEDFEEQKK